jgi:glycine cleavage system H protein
MSDTDENTLFTKDHEWLRPVGDGVVVVGITDHAQSQLGDLVFVQLPSVGSRYEAGDELAVIESVKAAGDIKAPLAGEVVEVNESVAQDPSQVNNDPLNGGWFVKLKLDDEKQLSGLMSAAAYKSFVDSEA